MKKKILIVTANYYKNISHRSLLINGHESEILQTQQQKMWNT